MLFLQRSGESFDALKDEAEEKEEIAEEKWTENVETLDGGEVGPDDDPYASQVLFLDLPSALGDLYQEIFLARLYSSSLRTDLVIFKVMIMFAIVTIICDDQVTVKVMNCLPHIYATYKVVKVNEEEEKIVLQVLGELVCIRLWGRLFSGGGFSLREDFLWWRILRSKG